MDVSMCSVGEILDSIMEVIRYIIMIAKGNSPTISYWL